MRLILGEKIATVQRKMKYWEKENIKLKVLSCNELLNIIKIIKVFLDLKGFEMCGTCNGRGSHNNLHRNNLI